jgi:hypothetical protein
LLRLSGFTAGFSRNNVERRGSRALLRVPPEGPEREEILRALSQFGSDERVDAALLRIYQLNSSAIQTERDGGTFEDALDWITRQSGHHQHAVRFLTLYSRKQTRRARKRMDFLVLIERLCDKAGAEVKVRSPDDAPKLPERPILQELKRGFFARLIGW